MFYALMVVDLILIGAAFFLWYRFNKEGILVLEEELNTTQTIRERNKSRPMKKSAPQGKGKRNKRNVAEEESENEDIDWEFGMVERNRGAFEEKREMDDIFGFKPTPKKEEFAEVSKTPESKRSPNKSSIDDIYGELFSEEEKESLDEFTPTINKNNESIKNKPDNYNFNNESIFEDQKENEEEYDFLNNYDFESHKEETLDDEIFERARKNKKDTFEDDSDLLFGDTDEDEFEFEPKQKKVKKSSNHSLIDEEDEVIFARFENLKNKIEE